MKSALRRGTYGSLNLYFQSNLQEISGNGPAQILLGFCTLPSPGIPLANSPNANPEEYVDDGCNILSSTLPGGNYAGYNLGGTTIHETGHWLGLLHTFQGQTCSPTDFGDYVADTPQQSIPTEGCPEVEVDSCPTSGVAAGWDGNLAEGETGASPYGPSGYSGTGNQRNYMDYSSDVCYEGFTGGQGARIVNLVGLYRTGR
jgi:hypothetical protein